MNYSPSVIDIDNLISESLLRLRRKSPFFGTLAMFARFIPSKTIPTAATNGRDIFFNPEFLHSLPSSQQDGVILHEVLHAALLHPLRLQVRDAKLWNVAADIVVNGIILAQSGCDLPPGGLRDEALEGFSVEEVYSLLERRGGYSCDLQDLDLLANDGNLTNHHRESLQTHWRTATEQANVIVRGIHRGESSGRLDRELKAVTNSQLDWRSYLWRYLVQTPTDFQGFDRRFAYRGLYIETLQGESVRVYIAVDTSASISEVQFQLFLEEVRGIVGSYPHLDCQLFYVDSVAHGPYLLSANLILPISQGGGGTSFIPFFDRVTELWDGQISSICVYFTDGYGEFPISIPALPTLWIVTPGGLDSDLFPFGEVVRSIEYLK